MVNAGSLKLVTGIGKTAEDDDDLLDLPGADGLEDEELGVADADELLFNDLADEPEDVGLDTEALGGGDLAAGLDQDDEEEEGGLLDDAPLDVDAEIDAGEEEQGWTDDSEGGSEGWDDELLQDPSGEGIGDDAGEEGVDDPLLDGLPEEGGVPAVTADEEDADTDDAWAEEISLACAPPRLYLAREIAARA